MIATASAIQINGPAKWMTSPRIQTMTRMTIMVHRSPAIDYCPPPVVVDECVVVLLPEFVVLFVAELLDHGCQTKIAIKMAITTTITMPSAAAPPPLPLSLTTTGPSAIPVPSPFEHQAALVIPKPGKRLPRVGEALLYVG